MTNPADTTTTDRAEGEDLDLVEAELGPDTAADLDDPTSIGPAGTAPDATDEPGPEAADSDEPILEMRQVAGLTSGSVMELHVGSFQFQESESDVGFALVVQEDGGVVVVPGTAAAHVDEIPLIEPTPLHDSVLNVGSACFTVRRRRPDPTSSVRLQTLASKRRPPGAIRVPDLTPTEDDPTQQRSNRFGALFAGRLADGTDASFDGSWWSFLDSIRDARSQVAERHRWLHPDPEELRSRVGRLDPGLWDRPRTHHLFGRVALAYATIPWQPRFDDPDLIPTELHDPIREMSQLPWVPVTANLSHGPLGIVGSRPAVLAAARNVVLSLACLSAPDDIVFSIVTAKGLIEDWSWTTALPNSLFPDGTDAFPIAVADGMVHFEGAGFEHEAVLRNELGLIVLAERPDELPEYCGTVLQIAPDGRCQVSNHLGEQVAGTPIGVTAGFAASLAAAIAVAVDDEAPAAPPPAPAHRPRREDLPPAPTTAGTTIAESESESETETETESEGRAETDALDEPMASDGQTDDGEVTDDGDRGEEDLDALADEVRAALDLDPIDAGEPDDDLAGDAFDIVDSRNGDLHVDQDLDLDPDLDLDTDGSHGDDNGAGSIAEGATVTADEFADELGELFQQADDEDDTTR